MIRKYDTSTTDFTCIVVSGAENSNLQCSTAQNDIALLKKRLGMYQNKLKKPLKKDD